MKTTIYICSNLETIQNSEEYTQGEAQEIIDAGTNYLFREICDLRILNRSVFGHLDYRADNNFRNWHGGIHCNVPRTRPENWSDEHGTATQFGYSAGKVVTHRTNPPKALCDICDKAQERMDIKAAEINKRIKWLECSCCGTHTLGRQWWNQDTGYGICTKCWRRFYKNEGTSIFGERGVHFAIKIPKDALKKLTPWYSI